MSRNWICLALLALLAGCSNKGPQPAARNSQQPAAQALPGQPANGAAANPEPVAPPPAGNGEAEPPRSSAASAEAPERAAIEIPRGVPLHVRLDQALSTKSNGPGDRFRATLSHPLAVDGRTVLPAGTVFTGHITDAAASGRLKGRAVLSLTLDGFHHDGREYRIQTGRLVRVSAAHKKRNLGFIAGGSGLGAVIGAIAGGGKGAAIGAAAGAGAGTAGAYATGKQNVELPAEAALTFSLQAPVRL